MKDTHTVHLPPGYPRNFAAAAHELDLPVLAVSGEVPGGLQGSLLRTGPHALGSGGAAHWCGGGAGMLHVFGFNRGGVSYCSRWVRSGCTQVVVHAGQVLALQEAGAPLRLRSLWDVQAQAQAQPFNFLGGIAGPFTAHPKLDPVSGELVFFGYGTPAWLGAGMVYGTVNAMGKVTRAERFVAPYASLVHDFAITARHALFPVTPLVADPARAAAGGPAFAWQPERAGLVGLLRRDAGLDTIQWRAAPPGHVFHVMNAWEDARRIHLDVMQADAPAGFTLADGQPIQADTQAYLSRWTYDLDRRSTSVTQEWLCDIPGEYPRIDERYTGLLHQHGWFIGDGAAGQPFARIVHVDHGNGRLDVYDMPQGDCVSEAVFVPRSPGADEGDGWLLCIAYRGRSDLSDLLVFDAQQLKAGPLATAHLPCRVPNGQHGTWIDAATGFGDGA